MNNNLTLISSEEFEKVLEEGANYKKEVLTTYKQRNKSDYHSYCEIMYAANHEVESILNKKKKNRTEAENEILKKFKEYCSLTYRHTIDLLAKEELEDNKKSKIEKIVSKIVPVYEILRYIGSDILDKEFQKYGLTLTSSSKFEDKYSDLNNDDKRKAILDIFTSAVKTKDNVNAINTCISQDLYQTRVPVDLQYDKTTNNTGIKSSDFKKLVDIKTKLVMAQTDDAKEHVEEKIQHIAEEKQFEAARAELLRDKITTMQ